MRAGPAAGTRSGAAKQATIHPVVILDCDGTGKLSTVMNGMQWVQNHHPNGIPTVILMPFTASYDDGGYE